VCGEQNASVARGTDVGVYVVAWGGRGKGNSFHRVAERFEVCGKKKPDVVFVSRCAWDRHEGCEEGDDGVGHLGAGHGEMGSYIGGLICCSMILR
jgi:hypothetical protein